MVTLLVYKVSSTCSSLFTIFDSFTIDFPRVPTSILKRHITDEANNQLAKFVQYPTEEQPLGVELPPKPHLPDGLVDAPLIRLYNLLRM